MERLKGLRSRSSGSNPARNDQERAERLKTNPSTPKKAGLKEALGIYFKCGRRHLDDEDNCWFVHPENNPFVNEQIDSKLRLEVESSRALGPTHNQRLDDSKERGRSDSDKRPKRPFG